MQVAKQVASQMALKRVDRFNADVVEISEGYAFGVLQERLGQPNSGKVWSHIIHHVVNDSLPCDELVCAI